ncbi:hypothetical protein FACS189472_09320 [Alphaproteobacteria bacterium]|nr:hypothetical protein FACS189472_09320 [Alphaproteobacteria bacterium]
MTGNLIANNLNKCPNIEKTIADTGQFGVLDIIRIKRLMQNTEKAEDFRYIFNERAAILEFDAGYERKEAEAASLFELRDSVLRIPLT